MSDMFEVNYYEVPLWGSSDSFVSIAKKFSRKLNLTLDYIRENGNIPMCHSFPPPGVFHRRAAAPAVTRETALKAGVDKGFWCTPLCFGTRFNRIGHEPLVN